MNQGIQKPEHFHLVSDFYQEIDNNDIGALLKNIDDNIVYSREDFENGGFMDIIGKTAFEDFYLNTRKLEGKHTVVSIEKISPSTLRVQGIFSGTNNGEPIELSFADSWTFDGNKVIKRISEIKKINS